jgi:CubicO group peptidase (beta-lactamase class C family)
MSKIHSYAYFNSFIFLLVFILSCNGQSDLEAPQSKNSNASEQVKSDKIDELVRTYADYGEFNGSILVSENGKIIYKNGFGFANMEWDIPNASNTKHRLASITKQFTAMLIIQLVEENKLALDVLISTYLPDYPKKNGDRITIHQLLTHTSGTPEFDLFITFKNIERNHYRPKELVDMFAAETLQFTPGERYAYSNTGYILLGYIIEIVTGKTYEDVLQEKIFTPLKMNDTGYDHHRAIVKNRASGYFKSWGNYFNANYIDMSIPYAAGSIYSTVEDLYLWDQALYSEILVSKKYSDLLFDMYVPAGSRYYGYGWFTSEMSINKSNDRVKTISHGGGIDGFNTLITRFPSNKSAIILLNNTGRAPLYQMTFAINRILHDEPYKFPEKSVAYSLYDIMEKDGIPAGVSYYEDIKYSNGYYLDHDEMLAVGYKLLHSGETMESVAVFKLCIEEFENSFNAYDSYGEALMESGNKEEAIENYKKSIELNPGNQNGINVLKEMDVDIDDLLIHVPMEHLKLLEGEYVESDQKINKDEQNRMKIDLVDGELICYDKKYKYILTPIGDDEFVNQRYGVSLEFDSKDKNEISFVIYGNVRFKKAN